MNYLLMNKDDRLLAFRTETGPLGTVIRETASYTDRRPQGWEGIEHWVDARNYAKHKDHFRGMLKDWHLDTPDGFLQISHALGLNDTLWVRPEPSALRWSDVSLYAGQFDDIAARTAFETGLHGLPGHLRYNLPPRRMERLNEIFARNYDCIRNGKGAGCG